MTVAVGDVVRIVCEWDIPDGTIAQLVYHYIGVSGTTATDAQVGIAAEAAIDAAWNAISARVSNQILGSTVETYLWDFVLNRWDGIHTVPLIGADGASASPMIPHGAAALLKLFTDAARRQARKYIMGFDDTQAVDGTFTAGALTDIALFGVDLDDDIAAGGLTLEFGTFNTDPLSPLFETFSNRSGAVQAEAIVAYQRRRRPGTGI